MIELFKMSTRNMSNQQKSNKYSRGGRGTGRGRGSSSSKTDRLPEYGLARAPLEQSKLEVVRYLARERGGAVFVVVVVPRSFRCASAWIRPP